jgi:DNA polymerase III delta prime subunit
MRIVDERHYLWAEKYRPQCVDDIIIPASVKKQMQTWVKSGQIPNIGLFGSVPGTGKSTFATVILKELDADYLWINASADGGIDKMRTEIPKFAQSVSINGKPKIVVLDEADNLTAVTNGAQFAIRGIIEKYAVNCRFMLTGNYKERIIEPILNRLVNFDLDELAQMYKQENGKEILNRLKFILDNEGVKYDPKALGPIITSSYPSIREMTVTLQKLTVENDDGELELMTNDKVFESSQLMRKFCDALVLKDFFEARKIITELADHDAVYSFLWKHIEEYVEQASIPQMILIIANFQDQSLRARDKSVTLAAFVATVLMTANIQLKQKG